MNSFPLRCPDNERHPDDIVGCGSDNLDGPDNQGFYDCLNCGMFFKPEAGVDLTLKQGRNLDPVEVPVLSSISFTLDLRGAKILAGAVRQDVAFQEDVLRCTGDGKYAEVIKATCRERLDILRLMLSALDEFIEQGGRP